MLSSWWLHKSLWKIKSSEQRGEQLKVKHLSLRFILLWSITMNTFGCAVTASLTDCWTVSPMIINQVETRSHSMDLTDIHTVRGYLHSLLCCRRTLHWNLTFTRLWWDPTEDSKLHVSSRFQFVWTGILEIWVSISVILQHSLHHLNSDGHHHLLFSLVEQDKRSSQVLLLVVDGVCFHSVQNLVVAQENVSFLLKWKQERVALWSRWTI